MSNSPKISIVTPSFNQGKYIEETILSILNQSYKNYELIIIDGGSTDETLDVIKKYKDRIDYFISEKDNGQTDAIVKGLQKCTGEIFNWINSDDRLADNSLALVAEAYVSNNNPDLIAGNIIRFNNECGSRKLHLRTDYWNNIPRTLGTGQMCQPGMFYKTEIVRQIGMNTQLHYSMDVDLFYRFNLLSNSAKIVPLDCVLAEFREHSLSKTGTDSSALHQSAFFSERLKIMAAFVEITEKNEKLKSKLGEYYRAEELNTTQTIGRLSGSKKRILNKTIDYFLVERLTEALHTFDRPQISSLAKRISWTNINIGISSKIATRLLRHFSLFIRNSFSKVFAGV